MENQFRRLAILASISALLGFGSASGYSYYESDNWYSAYKHALQIVINLKEQCRESRNCDLESLSAKLDRDIDPDSSLVKFQEHYERFETFRNLAIGVPLLVAFLFFGLRWVITGKPPRLLQKGHGEPPSETPQQ